MRSMVHRNMAAAMVVALLLAPSLGCAGRTNQPEVTALQVGSAVLTATTALQRGITAQTDAKVLPVALAGTLTGYVQQVYDKSGPFGEAVKLYHDTTNLDVKKLKAAEIVQLAADMQAPLSKLLGTKVPEGAVQELTRLAGNVLAAVTAVQAEVARTLAAVK